MPSCFVEEQLTQRRERRVGHVPQSEHGGLSRAVATAWTSALKPLRESRD
jgi:hypothetical protein